METMMKRQEELIQSLFQQIGQLGTQNRETDGVQNGAGPSGIAPGSGGAHLEHEDLVPEGERGVPTQPGGNRGMNAQSRGRFQNSLVNSGGRLKVMNEDCISVTTTDWRRWLEEL